MFEEITDNNLMKKFSNCSKQAFDQIYERNKLKLTNYLMRAFLLKHDIAEDIAQDALIKVYENKFKYNPKFHFSVWLYTIARNLALNEIKRHAMKMDYLENENKDNKSDHVYIDNIPDFDAEIEKKAAVIKSEIQKLDEKYREVLILRYIENMSLDEIQSITGKNLNTLKSLLKRGLEKLREKLKLLNFEDI
jgi:RNA polymerase sigma-70 factor, ECF subfamily